MPGKNQAAVPISQAEPGVGSVSSVRICSVLTKSILQTLKVGD